MTIFDDLAAEQGRLEAILLGLDEAQWLSPSGAAGGAGAGGADAGGVRRFGPPDAESAITGTAGDFCRVAAQRLDPARSGLRVSGPHGAIAVRVLRTYAA